jgi:hypothetical protein
MERSIYTLPIPYQELRRLITAGHSTSCFDQGPTYLSPLSDELTVSPQLSGADRDVEAIVAWTKDLHPVTTLEPASKFHSKPPWKAPNG